ncbi:MAG: hypothetical protein HY075_03460 [Deltaproteobacteria bacterium]|nr:hypothetical protein [Deltaproteobacteria bacterium]
MRSRSRRRCWPARPTRRREATPTAPKACSTRASSAKPCAFSKARAVLRADFAEPAKAATDVNFLAAFVELGSAFARLKVLLKRSLVLEIQTDASLRPADLPFELVIHHLKRFFTELTNGFTRARYSYGKVSKFVVGYQGKPLVKIQNHTFVFSEEIGLTSIARFALDVLHDNSYTVNYDINHFIQQNLQGMGAGVVRVLHVLDRVQFQEGFTDRLRIAFHFQTAFSRLLGRLADDPGSFAQVDVFTLLIGTPPAILRELGHSFQKSWDEEDGAHLRRYLETTKGQWNQLNGLLVDWEEWSKTKLTGDQQAAILAYVKTLQSEYPDVFAAPVHLDSDSLRDYQAKAIALDRREPLPRALRLSKRWSPTTPRQCAGALAPPRRIVFRPEDAAHSPIRRALLRGRISSCRKTRAAPLLLSSTPRGERL